MKYPSEETRFTDEERALVCHVDVNVKDERNFDFHFIFEEDAINYAISNPTFGKGLLKILLVMHDQLEAHLAVAGKGGKHDA